MLLTIIWSGLVLIAIVVLAKTIRVVPQKSAYIIERLGKYKKTLTAGFHILVPLIDKVAYKHTLKEQALDVVSQTCITRDNISVEVDGILYLQVMDAVKSSYGIDDYQFASTQLAQTTMRSIIGRMELDKTFEERETINNSIVEAVDKASDPWGVKVTRYEVKNITPPQSIKDAMEKQMRAEREKRATIAESEGDKQAKINRADGEKQELIARSEGEKQRRINEAEGRAAEIEKVAVATAIGLKNIAGVIKERGGAEAVNLRIAEQYIDEFGNLARENNTMILPSNLTDIGGMVATIGKVLQDTKIKLPKIPRPRMRKATKNLKPFREIMKSTTEYLTFNVPQRMDFLNITPRISRIVEASGIKEGLCLVNAMHITASVFINDDEPGLHEDYKKWLETLAPFDPSPERYHHNRTGEDNGDAHHKRQVMGREVVVAVTGGKLDFGPWEQIFYGEFDGRRPKRVLVKVIGE